jgi:hypothetical protein
VNVFQPAFRPGLIVTDAQSLMRSRAAVDQLRDHAHPLQDGKPISRPHCRPIGRDQVERGLGEYFPASSST